MPAVLLLATLPALAQTALEPGRPIAKTIRAGEVHRYSVEGPAGAFIRGSVQQEGIGINVRGFFPDGSKIRNFAGPRTGAKTFRFVVEIPGRYQLELTGLPGDATEGRYTIAIESIQPIAERLSIPFPERYASPRIRALEKDVAAGNRDALAAFWREIEQRGTPLSEPIATDPDHLLVTFLWRATFETHNVLVVWNPYSTSRPDDFRMTQLAATDLWYKTLRFPKGSRFLYQLSPNDTLTRAPNAQRYATAQADPLNRHRVPADPNVTRYEVLSIAELPGAAPQPWSDKRPAVPAGELHSHRAGERSVTVYTPPGYRKDAAPLPFLLLFDATTYQTDVPAPVMLDNLIAEKRIAPMAAILVEPTPNQRGAEFFGNLQYADFVARELVPWAVREYHLSSDPTNNIIGGLSAGGFAAAFIALHHPELFGKVLSQSGAFWWAPNVDRGEERNSLARDYAAAPRRNLIFYLEAGLFENDIEGVGGQILEHNRHLRDVLRAKGYTVHYNEFPGGHDRLTWRGSLADALLLLCAAH